MDAVSIYRCPITVWFLTGLVGHWLGYITGPLTESQMPILTPRNVFVLYFGLESVKVCFSNDPLGLTSHPARGYYRKASAFKY